MNQELTHLVSDPIKPRKRIWLTERELALVNAIRVDKGIGPVIVWKIKEGAKS